jgi:hypothetical protein
VACCDSVVCAELVLGAAAFGAGADAAGLGAGAWELGGALRAHAETLRANSAIATDNRIIFASIQRMPWM